MRAVLAFSLWLAQLVAPAVGLLYIQARLASGQPLGPQALTILVVCLVWCLLCLGSMCSRPFRLWLVAHVARLLIAAVAAAFALLLAEGLLTIGDVALDIVACRPHTLSWWAFTPEPPELDPGIVIDPVAGLRFNPDVPHALGLPINRQGFCDRDDFRRVRPSATARILLLGDSFAWGAAANYDGSESGFADMLEGRLQRELSAGVVLWNTGIPSIGQEQQLLHLKEFFPLLKPQVVLLAFCVGNDFTDNLYPLGNHYVFADGLWTYRYVPDHGGYRELGPREAWLKARQYPYEEGPLFACLRTLSLVYRQFPRTPPPTYADGLSSTTALLTEIAAFVRRHGAAFLVLVIPTLETVQRGGDTPEHATTLRLLRELALPYLDPLPQLTEADYMPAPDQHWTKAGHKKIADLLFQPVARLLAALAEPLPGKP